MKVRFLNVLAFGLLLIALAGCRIVYGQSSPAGETLHVPVNDHTVVMFYYMAPLSYAHPPLIFRVAKSGSPLLNTAPIINLGGRTPYVSIMEMRNLVRLLAQFGLSWHQDKQMKTPGLPSFEKTTGQLEIRVFSAGRVMLALSNPKKLCQTLPPLEAALKQPRARWEFELWRLDYGCSVPGFNRNAYPQHYTGNE